jgi:hypothetical protein
MIQNTIAFLDDKANHPLLAYKENISYVSDIILGFICMCKGDFKNIKCIAVKLGGFPDPKQTAKFFKTIKSNKDVLNINFGPFKGKAEMKKIIESMPSAN